jgi:hypothetical protein
MALNLTDIVALAKAGYKPSDVKELIELASAQKEEPAKEKEVETKDQAEVQVKGSSGSDQPSDETVKATGTASEDSAILSYKEKIEELEGKLSKLQSDNVHRNNIETIKNQKSDEELLDEITRSYM